MKNFRRHIRQSLSWQLSLGILLFVMLVFAANISLLFMRSRQLVQKEAIERSTRSLECTAMRVRSYLDEVEVATRNTSWLVPRNLRPDSLLVYTRRVVELNPLVNGCSVTLEPYAIPSVESFSAYSVRGGNVIETVEEAPYDYYSKVWYSEPKRRRRPCWVDPYNDFTPGTLSSPVMIASYGQPLFSADDPDKLIGVISTDLSVGWLFQVISGQQPYPRAYCMLLGSDGRYFVHPDTQKQVKQSIFTSHDDDNIKALGHEMVGGKKGVVQLDVNGESCFVCYQPIEGTGWSIALVCPEYDVFERYNRQILAVTPILVVGLLLMLLLCRSMIVRFLKPLERLTVQTRHVADGHFDELLAPSTREDVVGRLQNNFITMQENISAYISSIHHINAEAEERNKQLAEAGRQVQEANQRMTDFVHEMSQQMRTPLNLIVGFVQLLKEGIDTLSPEERKNYIDAMWQGAFTIKRMAHMLFDVSWLEKRVLDLTQNVDVNDVVRNSMQIAEERFPEGRPIELQTALTDGMCIHTNRLYLYRLVREILMNAKKFAKSDTIRVTIGRADAMLHIVVEDHGDGIPEADREKAFEPFVKFDKFTEGLGLGLGLSRQIARLLKGTLVLDPDYTEGARFIIEIPYV